MVRKLAFLTLFLVFGAISYLGYSIYDRMQEKQAIEKRIASLPEFSLVNLDGRVFSSNNATKDRPAIFTYFNTKCHFCQGEIRSMQSHEGLQEQAEIYLISDQSTDMLRHFRRSFKLGSLQSMHIMHDRNREMKKLYGVRGVPNTFVYGKDGCLLKSFKGETNAEVLYQLIK